METNTNVYFVYTGQQSKDQIPRSVTHLTVVLDPSTQRIHEHAFENCSHLVQVSLVVSSASLQTIGKSAFRQCKLLKSIQFPLSVEIIEDCAFESCDSLKSVMFPESPPHGTTGGLKRIGRRSFRWCQSLESVSLPSTVEVIDSDAFHWCPFLLEVNLNNGLKKIGEGAFAHCTEITALVLPSTLATVGTCAFHSCDLLMEVGIEHTQLRVLTYATFSKCYSLCSITLPKTLKTIGKCAFFECRSLVHVDFPKGLKNIATKAFSGCKVLCGIVLPSTLESIGAEAFEFCTSLLCVELARDSRVQLGPHCFRGCEALVTISIPPRCIDSACDNDAFDGCDLIWTNENEGGPIEALRDRYEHLPVHDICYHSSSDRQVDDLVQTLDSLSVLADYSNLKDDFGMTSLHVIATSVRPNMSLLQDILYRYPSKIIECKDKRGRTMMDYMLMHTSNSATRLIKFVLQRFVVDRITRWSQGTDRNLELARRLEAMQMNNDTIESRRKLVHKVFNYAGFCIMVEMASLIELTMWKMKINKMKVPYDDNVDRTSSRYQCGADIATENVMGFLWDDGSKSDAAFSMFPLYSLSD